MRCGSLIFPVNVPIVVETSFTSWGSTLADAVKTAGALAQEFGAAPNFA